MGLGIVGMWLVDTDLRGGGNWRSGEAGGQVKLRGGKIYIKLEQSEKTFWSIGCVIWTLKMRKI